MNAKQQAIKNTLLDELCGMLGVLSDDMEGHIGTILYESDDLITAGFEVSPDEVSLISRRLLYAMNEWLFGTKNEAAVNVWGYVLEGIE